MSSSISRIAHARVRNQSPIGIGIQLSTYGE
jgi:hypothetical protein